MQTNVLFSILRTAGYVVMLLMLAAIVYASGIGIGYWAGIGV